MVFNHRVKASRLGDAQITVLGRKILPWWQPVPFPEPFPLASEIWSQQALASMITVGCHKYSHMVRADPLYSANHSLLYDV
jgi:hypothetical protein